MAEEIITVYKTEVDEALNNHKKVKAAVLENAEAEVELTKTIEASQKKRVKLLEEEIEDLEELKKMREKASSVEEIEAYNKRIKETESRINTLKDATGKLADKTDELGNVGEKVFSMLDSVTFGLAGKFREVYKSIQVVIRSMGILRAAFLALGIGALIATVATLIGIFTATEKGADALKAATNGLSAAWSRWVVTVSEGNVPIKFAILSMIVAFKEAAKLAGAVKNLEDAQRELSVVYAQSRESIAKYNNTIMDTTKSEEERIAAANKALAIEFKLLHQREQLAEQAIQIAQRSAMLAKGSAKQDEALDNLAHAEIELARIREESITTQTQLTRRLNNIREEVEQKRKQQAEEEKKQQLEAMNRAKIIIEQEANERLIILERLFTEGRIKEEDYQNSVLSITRNKLEKLKELEKQGSIDYQNIELEKFRITRQINENIAQAQEKARQSAIELIKSTGEIQLSRLNGLNAKKAITEEAYNKAFLEINLDRVNKLQLLEQVGSLRYEQLQLERLQLEADYAQKSIDIQQRTIEQKRTDIDEGARGELLIQERRLLLGLQSEEQYDENVKEIRQRQVDELLKLETAGSNEYADLVNEKLRIDEEYAEKAKELAEEAEEKKREEIEKTLDAIEESFNQSTELANTVIDGEIEAAQNSIESLNEQQEAQQAAHEKRLEQLNEEMALARNSDKEKIKLKIKTEEALFKNNQEATERQISEERKRVANFKKAQLAIMTIQEAVSIGRAFAELGPVAGLVAAAALAIKFALLFNQIEEGQFNEGTDYVKRGKNKPGIDTIPARLTEGEAVIPVKQNMKNRELVKSLIRGNVDDYINNRYVMPRLTELIVGPKTKDQKFNDNNIVTAIKSQTRSAEKNSRKVIQTLERSKNRKRGVA